MTHKKPAFLLATALFCVGILPSAVLNIVQPDFVVEAMTLIHMPMAAIALVGMWKILGVMALIQPWFPRIKEWAYAGFFFDLTGAAFLHAAAGDTTVSVISPLVFLIPLAASYMLRTDTGAVAATTPSPMTVAATT